MKKTLHQKGYFLSESFFEVTDERLSVKTKKMFNETIQLRLSACIINPAQQQPSKVI